MTVGPSASANVSSSSTRPIGPSTVTGCLKTMSSPNEPVALGVPKSANPEAAAAGVATATDQQPGRHDGRDDAGASRRPCEPGHAHDAETVLAGAQQARRATAPSRCRTRRARPGTSSPDDRPRPGRTRRWSSRHRPPRRRPRSPRRTRRRSSGRSRSRTRCRAGRPGSRCAPGSRRPRLSDHIAGGSVASRSK